jgi:hypothetical protein
MWIFLKDDYLVRMDFSFVGKDGFFDQIILFMFD